jgi:hypothetical protein
MPTDEGPYVGPRPFEEKDAALFFGREREARDLVALCVAHPIVLVFGPSGAGKTSLLSARVIPALKTRGWVASGIRVGGQGKDRADAAPQKNIFVANALSSLQGVPALPAATGAVTFAEYLDQVRRGATEEAGLRVVIFDQFEELFTHHLDRWRDRESFFEDLGNAIERDRQLRIIFSMREEYLGSMDRYEDLLPEGLRTRFGLQPLREEAALLAVTRPLEGTGREFAPGAAEDLVSELISVSARKDPVASGEPSAAPGEANAALTRIRGEFVEPLHLQVACRRLWQSLPTGTQTIGKSFIRDFGDVETALASYYDSCVEEASRKCGFPQGRLRNWFEHHLIVFGAERGLVLRGPRTTAGLENAAVDWFEGAHLIRAEKRGDATWYELSHGRLVEPIQRANQRWRRANSPDYPMAAELERRSREWTQDGKSKERLLSTAEIPAALAWLAGQGSDPWSGSEGIQQFIDASRIAAEGKKADEQAAISRKRGYLLAALCCTTLLAILAGWSGWTNRQRRLAEAQESGNLVQQLLHEEGLDYIALAHEVTAIKPFQKDREPPKKLTVGLQRALDRVNAPCWLWPKDPTHAFRLSGDGKIIFTATEKGWEAWDACAERPLQLTPVGPFDGSSPPLIPGENYQIDSTDRGDHLLVRRQEAGEFRYQLFKVRSIANDHQEDDAVDVGAMDQCFLVRSTWHSDTGFVLLCVDKTHKTWTANISADGKLEQMRESISTIGPWWSKSVKSFQSPSRQHVAWTYSAPADDGNGFISKDASLHVEGLIAAGQATGDKVIAGNSHIPISAKFSSLEVKFSSDDHLIAIQEDDNLSAWTIPLEGGPPRLELQITVHPYESRQFFVTDHAISLLTRDYDSLVIYSLGKISSGHPKLLRASTEDLVSLSLHDQSHKDAPRFLWAGTKGPLLVTLDEAADKRSLTARIWNSDTWQVVARREDLPRFGPAYWSSDYRTVGIGTIDGSIRTYPLEGVRRLPGNDLAVVHLLDQACDKIQKRVAESPRFAADSNEAIAACSSVEPKFRALRFLRDWAPW